MANSRHKQASQTERPWRRRALRLAVPLSAAAVLAGAATVVVWPDPGAAGMQSSAAISAPKPDAPSPTIEVVEAPSVRVAAVSRSEQRVRLEPKPPKVVDHEFTTARLNVWTGPSEDTRLLEVLDWAERVAVTGEEKGTFAEIVQNEKSRWVHSAYLAETKPKPEPEPAPKPAPEPRSAERSASVARHAAPEVSSGGLSSAPCDSGSDVESGLASNAVAVHRAVCATFPQVSSYGGVRPGDDGEHGSGNALDIMMSGSTGDEIADFVRDNAGDLGVSEVIWSQQIWTVDRSSEGWRYMEDRGSDTANHYDHVHVTVY